MRTRIHTGIFFSFLGAVGRLDTFGRPDALSRSKKSTDRLGQPGRDYGNMNDILVKIKH